VSYFREVLSKYGSEQFSGNSRYSYQELTDKLLRRWDNATHFPNLPNFPHHHHDSQGNITESSLTGDPIVDLPEVVKAL
jgi:hypothetical protein